ncbi:MAG: cell division protein FtsQ/DivIB [Candidatus Omnitrophica bacterium]|nr:cell division protein FtsQ/DivIB [Candidatus Omnitrophota bacterium]
MKKKNKKTLSLIIILLIALGSAAALAWYAARAVRSSAFFRIKGVAIASNAKIDVSHLIGRNIFDVDLRREIRFLRNNYPRLRILSVVKRFPDRMIINSRTRAAIAQIKSYRYLFIDEEAVILPEESDYGSSTLPVIVGLESKISRPRYGWSYADLKEIKIAFELMKELKGNPDTAGLDIAKIDVSSPGSLSFSVRPSGLPIKVGDEDIKKRVRSLGAVLRKLDAKLDNLSYIDLRFSEPVVKPK